MADRISNGWYWVDKWTGQKVAFDSRWHNRFSYDVEDCYAVALKRSLRHYLDDYFVFGAYCIATGYSVTAEEAKKDHHLSHGFFMIQSVYVEKAARNRGIGKRFFQHCMNIADDYGCVLTAVCNPFEHEQENVKDLTLEEVARDFIEDSERLYNRRFSYVSGPEFEVKREKMKNLLVGLGWQKIDLRAKMENPNRHGDYGFAYFPNQRKKKQEDLIDVVYFQGCLEDMKKENRMI